MFNTNVKSTFQVRRIEDSAKKLYDGCFARVSPLRGAEVAIETGTQSIIGCFDNKKASLGAGAIGLFLCVFN